MNTHLPGKLARAAVAITLALGLVSAPASEASERRKVYALGQEYFPGPTRPEPYREMHIQKGDPLLFRNFDLASHNVSSVAVDRFGIPLFESETITFFDDPVEVKRASLLRVGTYRFFCTRHPAMFGVLVVDQERK